MRAVVAGCVAFLVGLLVLGVFAGSSPAQTPGIQKRFVVVFAGSRIPPGAERLIEAAGGKMSQTFPEVGIAVAISDSPAFPDALNRSALVQAVGEDRGRPLPDGFAGEFESGAAGSVFAPGPDPAVDDLYFSRQWHIRRVRADAAWAITAGASDVVVAVIDNGVASNHPDLVNLVFSGCFSSTGTCTPYPSIPFALGGSHGTMVAGIIGAAFGHGRVVGVGPNLSLASYNVFETDPDIGIVAFESSIWAAMLDAAARGFKVINLSLGDLLLFPERDAPLWTAWNRVAEFVTRKGVTILASAGNEGINLNGPVAHVPSDLPSVIGVGATGIRPDPVFPQAAAFDVRAFYSNVGAALSLVAPGGDCGPTNPECTGAIVGTQLFYFVQSSGVMPGVPTPTCVATASCTVGYVRNFGSSFAAPHVAGVAGLILSHNPNLRPQQVASFLIRTAQPLGDRQQFGHGMVDAAAAVGAP